MTKYLVAVAIILALTGVFVLAQTAPAKKAVDVRPNTNAPTKVTGDGVKTPSGLIYWDIRMGTGEVAKEGSRVRVHYTGWLVDGTKFDSSRDSNRPFRFKLGAGQVIKGWDEGVAGMRVGGKRKLIIPAELGYGRQGAGSVIPPGATLVFEVELLGIG